MGRKGTNGHCEERSDEAIQAEPRSWIASLRSQ
jgi:hypothetical protein